MTPSFRSCLKATFAGSPTRTRTGVTLDGSGHVSLWSNHMANAHDLDRPIATPATLTRARSGGGTATVVSFDGSSGIWADGAQFGNHTVAVDTKPGGIIFGTDRAQGNRLEVLVAEAIVYSQSLDPAERAAVESYLDTEWGDLIDLPHTFQSGTVTQTGVIQSLTNLTTEGIHR